MTDYLFCTTTLIEKLINGQNNSCETCTSSENNNLLELMLVWLTQQFGLAACCHAGEG